VLQAIGDVQQFRDDRDAALTSYHEALTLYRALGDRLGEANVRKAIGDVQQFRKELDAALTSYHEALTLYRALGARLGEANVLQAIGDVQQFRADRDAALTSYHEALTLYRALGDRLGEANVRKAIGDVQQFRKELDAALTSYHEALTLYRALGARLGEANVLAALSRLRLDDDPAASQQLLEQALVLRRAINDRYSEGADLGNYGIALLQRGRGAEALPYLQRARAVFVLLERSDVILSMRGAPGCAHGPIDCPGVGWITPDPSFSVSPGAGEIVAPLRAYRNILFPMLTRFTSAFRCPCGNRSRACGQTNFPCDQSPSDPSVGAGSGRSG
jgi:tetratricopeptide (TPR) repeat protein